MSNANTTLNMKDLIETMKILGPAPKDQYGLFRPGCFGGMPVIEVPICMKPKIQIDPSFPYCSDEFRAKMNLKLLKMFGSMDETPIRTNQAFMMGGTVLLRPEAAVMLRDCNA